MICLELEGNVWFRDVSEETYVKFDGSFVVKGSELVLRDSKREIRIDDDRVRVVYETRGNVEKVVEVNVKERKIRIVRVWEVEYGVFKKEILEEIALK